MAQVEETENFITLTPYVILLLVTTIKLHIFTCVTPINVWRTAILTLLQNAMLLRVRISPLSVHTGVGIRKVGCLLHTV